jgi:hypothetical protein
MIPELRGWTRGEMMKRAARWPWAPAFPLGHARIAPPPLRGRAGWGARAAHQESRSTASVHALAALSKLRQHPPPFLPRKGGGAEHKMRACPSAFAGATKKRFDLKRSRSKGRVLSFAAILSLLATAAAWADDRPSNSTACAFSPASPSAPIVDGHRLQPRACAFAASPDVPKSDARVVDELYRELIGHSATTPPSPPATPPSSPAENRR